jgi:NAD-dependent DNA ligase
MEFIIVVLFVILIILYSKNRENKNKAQVLEKWNNELHEKYKNLKSELKYYNTQTETENESKSSSKRKTENQSSYTQEDIISFSEKTFDKKYLYPQKDLEDKSHFFYGKKVVITGDFIHFEDRNEIAKLLWEVGADVDTGMGKNVKVLVVVTNPGPSKIMKGKEIGVDFVTESDFRELFKLN